jgi:Flp pilus assembly protein TadD
MPRFATVLALVVPMFAACTGANPHPVTSGPEPVPEASTATPAKSPDDQIVRDAIRRGEAALKAGDFKGAKELFIGVLDRKPGYARALHYLGVCNENLGDKAAAEKNYRDALAKAPELADAALNLSAMLMEAGRNDDAVKVLRASIEKTPADPMLHANLGHALLRSGDKPSAIAEYRVALKVGEDAATRLALASTLLDSGKKEEAQAELKKIATSSTSREMLATVGDALARTGAFAECVSAFDKAISVKAAPELHVQRGVCRHQLKDDAGAKNDYDAAIKLDKDYAPAWYYTGMYFFGQDKSAEAIKAFEKVRQLKPDGPFGKKATDRIAEIKKGKKK